ncbi:MAG: hypothetical protein JWM69_626 [Candidatus Binatus sp.]|nr:hypothetical protein [Candidatus Binatus sp.]
MLSENLWWFGSRSGFDDKLDCVLGGVVLTRANIEQRVRESGGNEEDLRKALNDSSLSYRVPISVQEQSIDSTGILCLSELGDDPRLWHDYADSDHGVCLCLSTGNLLNTREYSVYKPREMHYLDAPPQVWNPGAEDRLAQTAAVLLRKNTKWKYQKEWRILRPGGVGEHRMPTDSLVSVILGRKLSEAKKRRVAKWVQSGPWNPRPNII